MDHRPHHSQKSLTLFHAPGGLSNDWTGRAASYRVVAALLVVGVGRIAWCLLSQTEPVYQGQRVHVWYDGLCSGVFGGTPRAANFQAAYNAFAHMGPDAVPYLTNRLQYDRSGLREKCVQACRKVPVLKEWVKTVVWPSERRCYAAVALRRMGPRARAAIPAPLEACVKDCPKVRLNAVGALGAILHYHVPEGLNPARWSVIEQGILSRAARECPETASRLGISVDSAR